MITLSCPHQHGNAERFLGLNFFQVDAPVYPRSDLFFHPGLLLSVAPFVSGQFDFHAVSVPNNLDFCPLYGYTSFRLKEILIHFHEKEPT
jgi:hypothetical protein